MTTATHPHTLSDRFSSSELGSKALVPGSLGWDGARQAWNLSVDQHPAAVVFPETVTDVATTVNVAADHGLSVVVQGTGHGAAAYDDLSTSILIRTNRMRALDVSSGRCRVQAGTLWGEVAPAAGAFGLAALAGSSPDVGVVGYSLGGGIGWMSRRYGLAANAIRSIDVVTADGLARTVDDDRDPELFWALRGGGAGFGVVTSVEFDLMPVPRVYAGTMAWDASRAPELLRAWSEWTQEVEESITSIIRFLNLPDIPAVPEPFRGRRVVTFGAACVGDFDVAVTAVDALRRVASPHLDTFAVMPSSELVRLHGDPEGPTAGAAHHALLGSFAEEAIDALISRVGADSRSSLVSVEVRHLGGAVARSPERGGALSHIDAPYVVNAVGAAQDDEQESESRSALDSVVDSLEPWTAGAYLNFAERASDSPFDQGTIAALAAVKSRIDPDHRFRLRTNQHYTTDQAGVSPGRNH